MPKNLESLTVDNKFVAVYFGETGVTLDQRMRYNDLMEFLSWFPVTHISKLFQVKPNTLKRLRKDVTYVMEAFIAVLWESKLSDCINFKSGRCFNNAVCGYRRYRGTPDSATTYVFSRS